MWWTRQAATSISTPCRLPSPQSWSLCCISHPLLSHTHEISRTAWTQLENCVYYTGCIIVLVLHCHDFYWGMELICSACLATEQIHVWGGIRESAFLLRILIEDINTFVPTSKCIIINQCPPLRYHFLAKKVVLPGHCRYKLLQCQRLLTAHNIVV